MRTARALAVALADRGAAGTRLRRDARSGGGAAPGALGHAADRDPAGGRRAAGGGHAAVPAALRGDGDPARLPGAAGRGALAQRHEPAGARAGRRAGPSGGAGGAKRAGRRRRLARGRWSARPGRAARSGERPDLRLGADSRVVGRTLRQLDLRGLTGATVIAIDREPADVIYPTAEETLRPGDTLVVTGAAEAVEAAERAAPLARLALARAGADVMLSCAPWKSGPCENACRSCRADSRFSGGIFDIDGKKRRIAELDEQTGRRRLLERHRQGPDRPARAGAAEVHGGRPSRRS